MYLCCGRGGDERAQATAAREGASLSPAISRRRRRKRRHQSYCSRGRHSAARCHDSGALRGGWRRRRRRTEHRPLSCAREKEKAGRREAQSPQREKERRKARESGDHNENKLAWNSFTSLCSPPLPLHFFLSFSWRALPFALLKETASPARHSPLSLSLARSRLWREQEAESRCPFE